MHLQSIQDIKTTPMRILLRTDYNISFDTNHHIANTTRIQQSIPTIKSLLNRGHKVRIISHLGRPEKPDPLFSLQQIVTHLQKLLPNNEVIFIESIFSEDTSKDLELQSSNQIILFENIRFEEGENKNDPEFSKKLSRLGDIYVNDAFAVSHRESASIVGVTQYLPSYAGDLLLKEIKLLDHLIDSPSHPYVAIIGGAKTDKIQLLKKLGSICDTILIGGKFIAYLKDHQLDLVTKAQIIMPIDTINEDNVICDIGSQTIELYSSIISNARTIVWNGPMGITENEKFRAGTDGIIKAISKNSKCYSVIGGGDTITALTTNTNLESFAHISTGGGAMLEYIEKGTLPGIEALKKY